MIDFKVGDICPVCEKGVLKEVTAPFSFAYKGHIFEKNVEKLLCEHCRESFLYSVDEQKINKEAVDFRRVIDGLLRPDEVRSIRERNMLTQEQLSTILNIGIKNFSRYENGKFAQPQGIDLVLRSIDALGPSYIKLLASFTNAPIIQPGDAESDYFFKFSWREATHKNYCWPTETEKVSDVVLNDNYNYADAA